MSEPAASTPRRAQLDKLSAAEIMIGVAMEAVNEAGCDPVLTEAILLLGEAKDKVANYVDATGEVKS